MNRSVWIINHFATGPGRHEFFARELAKRGWEVKVFAASFLHNLYRDLIRYPRRRNHLPEDRGAFTRVWVRTPSYQRNDWKRILNHLSFTWRVFSAGRNMEPPGLIIGSSAHLLAAVAAFCLARRFRVPFIFEVRDFWPQSLVDMGVLSGQSPVTGALKRLELFLYSRAAKIISVVPLGEEYIAALGQPREKVVYIPNGTDPAWFDRCAGSVSPAPGMRRFFSDCRERGKLVFIYAGAHGPANGLETVVETAGLLQDRGRTEILFLMVGDGPAKTPLVRQAQKNRLSNLFFWPTVAREQIPALLSNSDVCLFHARELPVLRFGLSAGKFFDYLASGKPILYAASTTSGTLAGVPCGKSVPPGDPVALAAAALELAEMTPAQREQMGRAGRRHLEEHHSAPVLVDKLEAALGQVQGDKKTPGRNNKGA
ncbi:MAG: glycosyltransferase family 4 protein [Firmicutes bacterium]|nr:glycosyltransferase family 4 protein [Bacillota bacterium]